MGKVKCQVLVLGLGNLIMSDDGLGIRVTKMLKQKDWPQQVLILEVGTAALNYLDEIGRSYHVTVVDAVQAGGKPGRVYRFEGNNMAHPPGSRRDAHGFSILQVVELARELTGFPKKWVIYGVEPQKLDFGDRLSPVVEKALPRMVNQIAIEIKELINT